MLGSWRRVLSNPRADGLGSPLHRHPRNRRKDTARSSPGAVPFRRETYCFGPREVLSLLQRSQKIQNRLLVACRQGVESLNDRIRFRRAVTARTLPPLIFAIAISAPRHMGFNGLHEICCAAIVKEERSLSHAHKGVVRNMSPVALPWVMSSARPLPM